MQSSPSNTSKNTNPLTVLPAVTGRLIIALTRNLFEMIGGMFLLLSQTSRIFLKGFTSSKNRIKSDALFFQMVRVGVRAIPIVVLVGMAIGMILPLQMYPKLDEFGQADQVATINAIAAFRILGHLMTAIVLSGFAGASIAAELGTMVTAEEIEALESLALHPVRFLVLPRLLATVIMMVLLTVIADIVMVAGGLLTGISLGLDPQVYYHTTKLAVNNTSFVLGLFQGAVSGLLIGLIACYLGLSVKPWQGSEGVGKATTNTVVYCIVAIIVSAAIFTVIFYSYGLFK